MRDYSTCKEANLSFSLETYSLITGISMKGTMFCEGGIKLIGWFIVLAQPTFLSLVISSFFTQNKGGGGGAPPGPSPRFATGTGTPLDDEAHRTNTQIRSN